MKYDTSSFKGVFVAFNSLFDKNDRVHIDSVQKLAKKYVDCGVNGLYLCGSTGEGVLMNVQERVELTQAVVEAVGSETTIIVHIGAPCTRDACLLAQHAQKCGVAGISAVPSIYYRLSEESIALNWNTMTQSADLPFFIYNIPALTGYNLSLSLFQRMLENEKVCGIKNSSDSTWQIERFKTIGGPQFIVFNGPDEQFLAGRMMGADAGIGGTYGAMPELYVHLEKLIQKGEYELAKIWQQRINECIFALLDCSSLYGASKCIINLRYGIEAGQPRLPMLPVDINSDKLQKAYRLICQYIDMISE